MVALFTIDTHLNVPATQEGLVDALRDQYRRRNPKFASAQRMGYSTSGLMPYIHLYDELDGIYRFPREAVHHLPADAVIENGTTLGQAADLGRVVTLRENQVEPVDRMVRELERFKGGVLQSPPGSGKTVMALEIARHLGRKTAILVHTSFLMTQWRERIDQFLGVTAGTVQQDQFDVDHPIVLVMAQTINAREYPPEFFAQFGLVIVDEAHRFAADTFSEAVVKFPGTYRLGLTATPERQDELEWIFYAHIGPVVARGEVTRELPEVYIVPSALGQMMVPVNRAGKPDFVATITRLTEHPLRNGQIAETIFDGARNGRRIIVFSDRRAHLEELAQRFEEHCREERIEATYGFFVGGMSEAQRREASDRQVIFSTYQFAKEGLDIAELDTCVMASPKGDVTQVVGRIQRTLPGKPHPIVIDFADEGVNILRGLLGRRLRQYRTHGWTIHDWRD